jgi:8-oxo-dGTP pyrophosphatase MutT (NUDIX family)
MSAVIDFRQLSAFSGRQSKNGPMNSPQLLPLTIEDVRQALSAPLPGVEGQKKMAPQPRSGEIDRWANPENCREASVLLLLYPYATNGQVPELHLALTQRTEYPGVHSGQISLPGGRREGKESRQAAALREAMEEVGIIPNRLEMIGRLSPLYTPPSNFCIYPYVAFSTTRPNFRLEPQEVAELLEPPLSLLMNPANRREELWYFERYGPRRVPFFDVGGHKVWGATAMILSEFLALLTDHFLKR